jgi:hypothetical protein
MSILIGLLIFCVLGLTATLITNAVAPVKIFWDNNKDIDSGKGDALIGNWSNEGGIDNMKITKSGTNKYLSEPIPADDISTMTYTYDPLNNKYTSSNTINIGDMISEVNLVLSLDNNTFVISGDITVDGFVAPVDTTTWTRVLPTDSSTESFDSPIVGMWFDNVDVKPMTITKLTNTTFNVNYRGSDIVFTYDPTDNDYTYTTSQSIFNNAYQKNKMIVIVTYDSTNNNINVTQTEFTFNIDDGSVIESTLVEQPTKIMTSFSLSPLNELNSGKWYFPNNTNNYYTFGINEQGKFSIMSIIENEINVINSPIPIENTETGYKFTGINGNIWLFDEVLNNELNMRLSVSPSAMLKLTKG